MNGLHSEIDVLRDKLRGLFKHGSAEREKQLRLDLEKVMAASRILQISEFSFFHLAYSQWYGNDISDNRLEGIFSDYMFQDVVPHWVRHFARRVMLLFDEGALDPDEFNIQYPQGSYELRSAGYGYSFILLVIIIAFCFMLTGYGPS